MQRHVMTVAAVLVTLGAGGALAQSGSESGANTYANPAATVPNAAQGNDYYSDYYTNGRGAYQLDRAEIAPRGAMVERRGAPRARTGMRMDIPPVETRR